MKFTKKQVKKILRSFADEVDYVYDGSYSHADNLLNEGFLNTFLSKQKVKEKTIPFTYAYLIAKLSWETFCELTGTSYYALNEGSSFKDSDIFYLNLSTSKKYNLR